MLTEFDYLHEEGILKIQLNFNGQRTENIF